VHRYTPNPTRNIAPAAIKYACKSLTLILRAELREKSSSQLKHHIMAVAANKHGTARKAIGCKLATHPRSEEAMHPAMK
jgi:hypothetical protein